MRREMNILAMAKGQERFIFLYDDQSYDALIDVLDKFADDSEINLSSADAALLGHKARQCRMRSETRRFPSPDPHVSG